MADQQFCLRWNHHHTTLINVFESLLKDESLVDVTLYAEARPVRAHKVVLSACSPYFKAIFSAHAENHPVVILKDVLYSELRALVDYMYIGEVNVSQDQLASLIKTAESLKIKGLADGVNRKPPPPPRPPASPPVSLPLPSLPPMPMPMPTKRLPPSAPPMPALASLPSLASLPPLAALQPPLAALQPLPGLALPPPPSPFQHALRRSASPHAVPRGSPLGRPAADQLNGRVSPPPSKRARRPSGETSPASGGSPSPPAAAGDQPDRPPSAHSSPSLPRIPATITPLPPSRADSPAELDLSCRPPLKTEPPPPAYDRPAASFEDEDTAEQPQWHSDDGGDGDGYEELERPDEDRAGPSAPPAGTPGSDVNMLNSSGYMNWQLGGDGVEVPFIPATDAGGPQDKFLTTLRHFLAGEGGGAASGGTGTGGGGGGGGSTPPQCQRCGRLYSTRGNLRRHREYECGVEPRFSCSGCGRKFTHKHHMSSHVHSGRCSGAAWAQDQKPAWAGEWRHLADSDAVVLPSTGDGEHSGENGGAV